MYKRFIPISSINLNSSSININNIFNNFKRKRIIIDKGNHHRYKRSTHPTSVPLHKIFNNNFPLSIKQSFKDFKQCDPLKFQHDLLSLLPFYPNCDKLGRSSEILKIQIDQNGNYINEFVIYPKNKNSNMKHLIMIHGYGAGLGFYLKNFDEISKPDNWCIHAIDLFGYGCSSRPIFHPNNLEEVEAWFHDSFEKYLKNKQINPDDCLIMAHSMGAYLLSSYGIKKDANFCKKLICISPGAIIKHRKPVFVPEYFKKLWERNISPFTLVRKFGPLGSKLVSGWSYRRFAKLSKKEIENLHRYSYGIFTSPGSGEYMLNYLLEPGANARYPLIERGIHKINFKISWWYGKEDWMDKKGGELCSKIINNYHKLQLSDVKIVENSGHHIYLDNIEKFNSMIIEEMKQLE
ncbi:unnamed protein product [Candida verbasci]|uniref:AB hydrolase-1 domain-containing protein n=1 Tax=Candida verbasci TaxID=1227364 RepID=A0A9W4U016_9ASCO|nr:unnamed protein product [Candida verbasci]